MLYFFNDVGSRKKRGELLKVKVVLDIRHGIFEHGEGILEKRIICYIIRQMLALKFLTLTLERMNFFIQFPLPLPPMLHSTLTSLLVIQ